MRRRAVSSSLIASAGYEDGAIEIEFVTGNVYRYTDFSRQTFEDLCASPSPGAYFNRYIKGRAASCTPVPKESGTQQDQPAEAVAG